jgi:hypothetical protein
MFSNLLSNLPWLHVLVAAVAYFMLGALWYGPLFSKPWIRGHNINISDPDAKKGVGVIMVMGFIITVIICIAIQIVLNVAMARGIEQGVKWGLLLGLGFAATTTSMSYMYLKKPLSLHLIDGLYHVIGMAVAGVILAAWR